MLLNAFCLQLNIIVFALLYYKRNYIYRIFTDNTDVLKVANDSVVVVLIVMFLDSIQEVWYGSIRALGLQQMAL